MRRWGESVWREGKRAQLLTPAGRSQLSKFIELAISFHVLSGSGSGFILDHGSNALDIPNAMFLPTMSVALPNAGIDLVVVLNEAPDEKISVDIATAKVANHALRIIVKDVSTVELKRPAPTVKQTHYPVHVRERDS